MNKIKIKKKKKGLGVTVCTSGSGYMFTRYKDLGSIPSTKREGK
jgi:hypothetical protein